MKQKINTVCGSVQICKNFIRLRLPTCNSIESNIILLIIIHTICTRIMIAIIIKYILLHSILRSNFFFFYSLLFLFLWVRAKFDFNLCSASEMSRERRWKCCFFCFSIRGSINWMSSILLDFIANEVNSSICSMNIYNYTVILRRWEKKMDFVNDDYYY